MKRKALGWALISLVALAFFGSAFIGLGPALFLQFLGILGLAVVAAGICIVGIDLISGRR